MRDKNRSYSADLSEPTAITYVNGIAARTPHAWAWMWAHVPKTWLVARRDPGCLQATAWIGGPHKLLMLSYWRDEAALRAFYTRPEHIKLMRVAFRHQHWFTLFNETYQIPITTRYWNAPNGYVLSQPWQRAQGMQEFYATHHLHDDLRTELDLERAGTPTARPGAEDEDPRMHR